ncbi:MAG TPA: CHAT domain-containing protein [Thermomicrobiales bacterium]|nr:CHAT domain-containing protein [Thermomicrobiales bacterium]
MATFADLELSLRNLNGRDHAVGLRFNLPSSAGKVQPPESQGGLQKARFDLAALGGRAWDPEALGKCLWQDLFASKGVWTFYAQAVAIAASSSLPLRLRLWIHPDAKELNDLHWETLRDPDSGNWLAANEQIWFSRYFGSGDWRPVRRRPRSDSRPLIIVANPSDLEQYQLTPIVVEEEIARAERAVGKPIAKLGTTSKATLDNLVEQLRGGAVDVVYLVCHGRLSDGEPGLYLEGASGETEVVTGTEFIARVRGLRLPSLVVLASCQSAGADDARRSDDLGALAALGPQLAEIGVPAVVAMQGNISLATVERFMPVFFRELWRDGQIDRAITAARAASADLPDAWVPALFTRIEDGGLWAVPGAPDTGPDQARPLALLTRLTEGRCTPILGAGIHEAILGPAPELARTWADACEFPFADYAREDLAQVAQYLEVREDRDYLITDFVEQLSRALRRRIGDDLPQATDRASLDQLFSLARKRRIAEGNGEPHQVLAQFPLPIYVTTNSDELLTEALKEAGREPEVELCRWRQDGEWPVSVYERTPDFQPSVERPLVYHLLGQYRYPDSLVLTEDDYFDYAVGVTLLKDLVPTVVRNALAGTALLFLGFQMNDRDFRILFRSVLRRIPQSQNQRRPSHVGVQVSPEGDQFANPARVREYLISYFGNSDVKLYFYGVDQFVRLLLPAGTDPTAAGATR